MYTLMIKQYLYYKIHLFFTIKNRTLITKIFQISLILLISFLYNADYTFCMVGEDDSDQLSELSTFSDVSLEIEGENVPPYSPSHPLYVAPEYPETAEAKQELANQSPILQEIESYTASQEQLLKRLNDQADHYAKQENLMADRIYGLMQERNDLWQEISEARQETSELRHEYSETLRKAYDDAYKIYMEHFNKNS